MKCVNCFREIEDGIKFCPKCGFIQPEDREAYEREHPELADALPEEEIMRQVEVAAAAAVSTTAMSREEFERLVAIDPNSDSIKKMVDDGVVKFGFHDPAMRQQWYAKCAELINDKQGFYPYFVKLLSQQYDKARDLLFNQASYGMDVASVSEIDDELPPKLPVIEGLIIPPPLPSPSEMLKAQHAVLQKNIHSNLGYTLSSSGSNQSIECPICHNFVSPNAKECPFCHQQLDWNSAQQASNTTEKEDGGFVWIVPIILGMILLMIIIFGVSDCGSSEESRSGSDSASTEVVSVSQDVAMPAEIAADEEKQSEVFEDYKK